MTPAEVELARTALRELDDHHKLLVDGACCAAGAFVGGLAGFYLLFLSTIRFPRLDRLVRRLGPR